jgi:quercetin dioxygenase-like cupin family protein
MMKVLLPAVALAILAGPLCAQDAKVEIDNAWVRVIREFEAPRATTPMGSHPASLVVYLTPAVEKLTAAGGRMREVRRKPGEVAYLDAGSYARANVSGETVQAIIVELKDAASEPETPNIALDPVKLDPKHHLVGFENARVRVLRTILEPHLKSPLHQHPHYVVVYITELHTTQTLPDGSVIDNPRKPGEVAWRDALQHVTENIGEHRAEEIQIELK